MKWYTFSDFINIFKNSAWVYKVVLQEWSPMSCSRVCISQSSIFPLLPCTLKQTRISICCAHYFTWFYMSLHIKKLQYKTRLQKNQVYFTEEPEYVNRHVRGFLLFQVEILLAKVGIRKKSIGFSLQLIEHLQDFVLFCFLVCVSENSI